MSEKKRSSGRIIGGHFSDNGSDGIRIENADVKIIGATAQRNRGQGINIIESQTENNKPSDSPHKWYQKPRGVITLMVIGGLLLWAIKIVFSHFFPMFSVF